VLKRVFGCRQKKADAKGFIISVSIRTNLFQKDFTNFGFDLKDNLDNILWLINNKEA